MSFVLMIGGLAGCYQEPTLTKIEGIEFVELQDSTMAAKVSLSVFNPNWLGATIKSQNADLLMKDIQIGKAYSMQGFKLSGRDTTSIVLDAEINLNALSSIFDLLLEQDTATLTVNGRYKLKAGLSSIVMDNTVVSLVETRKELTRMLKQQMGGQNIRVVGIMPHSAGMGSMSMKVRLRVENNYSFDYQISQIALSIYADPKQEKLLGKWQSSEPTYLDAKSQQHLEGLVEVDNLSLFTGFTSLFKNRKAYARGSASVKIAGQVFMIPIVQDFDIKRQ